MKPQKVIYFGTPQMDEIAHVVFYFCLKNFSLHKVLNLLTLTYTAFSSHQIFLDNPTKIMI